MSWHRKFILIIALGGSGTAAVASLFLVTEDIMQNKNPFIRRFPPHIVEYSAEQNLMFNTYYFAGYTGGRLYLGNYSAPLHVIELEIETNTTIGTYKIDVVGNHLTMKSPRLRVIDSAFFLYDGSSPVVLSGNRIDWKVTSTKTDVPYFSFAEPIDGSHFIFRANASDTGQNILGSFSLHSPDSVAVFEDLVKVPPGESDPIFATDGSFIISPASSRISYVKRYNNEFVVAGTNGQLQVRGRTIDTVSVPSIKVVELQDKNQRLIGAPPLVVNRRAAASKNLLFVESALRGKYDDLGAWQRSSTIDVYSLDDGRYYFSFYLNGYGKSKLRNFCIIGSRVVVLIEDKLIIYNINQPLMDLL